MDIRQKFGARVKKLRLEKGISQEKLAHMAEIDRTYLPQLEKGTKACTIVVAERIAKALKVELKELF